MRLWVVIFLLWPVAGHSARLRLETIPADQGCRSLLLHFSLESPAQGQLTFEEIRLNRAFLISQGWQNPRGRFFVHPKFPRCLVWFDTRGRDLRDEASAVTGQGFVGPEHMKVWNEDWEKKQDVKKIFENLERAYEAGDMSDVMVFRLKKDIGILKKNYEHELVHLRDYELKEGRWTIAVTMAGLTHVPEYMPTTIAFTVFTELRAYYRNRDKDVVPIFNELTALITKEEIDQKALISKCDWAIEKMYPFVKSYYLDPKTNANIPFSPEIRAKAAALLADMIQKYKLDSNL